MTWSETLEVLGRAPLFLLDGAHNPQCAGALAERLRTLCPGKGVVFLTGVLADEEYGQIMARLLPLAQAFFCLTPQSDRALPGAELAAYLQGQGARATPCSDLPAGIAAALSAAGEDGVVVAFGSHYLAGAVGEGFRPVYRKWLRREKIRARDGLTQETREALSRHITARIVDTPEFRQAKTVLLYRAIRGEVRLEALERAALAAGKRLLFPRCTGDTELLALLPHGEGAWSAGHYGIEEPVLERSEVVPPEEIDLVLCPCTVFDQQCNRMGMGAGYYDRYLTKCSRAHVFSVAFEVQRAVQVPTDAWDWPMEATVTERAIYRRP